MLAFSAHFTSPCLGCKSPARQRKKVVLPMPFSPMMATFSPASNIILTSLNNGLSKPWLSFLISTALRYSFSRSSYSKRMKGYWREDGLNSSILILSICLARLVACLALEALAEKRRTKSCKSATCCLALSLSLACWARAAVLASM